MAFPSVRSFATTDGTTASGTPAVNLPATRVVGDTLFVQFRVAVAGAIGWPAGWSEMVDASPDAADDQIGIAWARVDGSEGSTISLTCTSGKFSALAFAVQGAADPTVRAPELSTVATGTVGAEPDATTCTPTGGAKDYLWITVFSMEGEQTGITSYPANFTTDQTGLANSGTGAAVTTNTTMAGASRQVNAASLDVGVWDVAGTIDDWSAYTVAFHPAVPLVEDGADSWFAGAKQCLVDLTRACAALTLGLTVASANTLSWQQDEVLPPTPVPASAPVPAGGQRAYIRPVFQRWASTEEYLPPQAATLVEESAWVVTPSRSAGLPTLFGGDDDFTPRAAVVEEDWLVLPCQPRLVDARVWWIGDEIVPQPSPVPAEASSFRQRAQVTPVFQRWAFAEERPTPAAGLGIDEAYWWDHPPLSRICAKTSQPDADDWAPPVSTAIFVEADWLVLPTQPRLLDARAFWADDEIVPQPAQVPAEASTFTQRALVTPIFHRWAYTDELAALSPPSDDSSLQVVAIGTDRLPQVFLADDDYIQPPPAMALVGVAATGAAGAMAVTDAQVLVGTAATGSSGAVAVQVAIALTGVAATGAAGTLAVEGSSETSAALVGVGSTGAIGTLAPAGARALTGALATGAAGSVAAVDAVVLTGVSATGAAGALTTSTACVLTGIAATASSGALGASSPGEVSLVGTFATGARGSLAVSTTVALSGVAATASAGTPTATISAALVGVSATGAAGSFTLTITKALSGLAGTSALGTVTSAHTQALTGHAATATPGSLGFTAGGSVTLTGVHATATKGAVSIAGDSSVGLTGHELTATPGTLAVTAAVPLTGVEGSGAAGSLTLTHIHALTGVSGTGLAGVVFANNDRSVALVGVSGSALSGVLGTSWQHGRRSSGMRQIAATTSVFRNITATPGTLYHVYALAG